MNVLFIDTVHHALRNHLEKHNFTCVDGTDLTRSEVLTKIKNYQGIVLRSKFIVDAEFLNAAQKLRFIARSGSGLENIDVQTAERKGVVVFNSPEGNCTAVAEHAMGMLLMLLNKLRTAHDEVARGIWRREENRGLELEGKTVGIIGCGHTGSAFAKRLQAFNCKVLAYDKYGKEIPKDIAQQTDMDTIYNHADVVSFHVPLTTETQYVFDRAFIDNMKKSFFVLNTSRGKVLNTADLVDGLKSKKVRGAALDVLEYENHNFQQTSTAPEPLKYLQSCDNVVLTPHVAGWTVESYEKLSMYLAQKITQTF